MTNDARPAGLESDVIDKLNEPIDPDLVQFNDFNMKKPDFEYLDRDALINNANRIFGYDGWGYRIVGDTPFTDTEPRTDKDGKSIRQGFYKAIVSVSVKGVGTRDGVGAWRISVDTPDSHDTAAAGAVTRALKRAFLTFGQQFGLELRSQSGRRAASRGRPPSGASTQSASSSRRVGAARVVKEWVDANENMTIPAACSLMGISSLGDREVTRFMADNGIADPERIPAALDRLSSAKAA